MTNYNDWHLIKRVEAKATQLGFKIASSPHRDYNDADIAIMPAEDNYPQYSRDAVICAGSFETVNIFLNGLEWSKQYYFMIKALDQKTIDAKENSIRHKDLIQKIKD